MIKISNRIISLLLLVFFAQFSAGLHAVQAAADSGGFSISPAFQEIDLVQSDKKKEFFVKISNRTDAIQEIRLEAVDFEDSGEPGEVFFSKDGNSDFVKKYGLVSWIRLEKNIIVLEPQSEEKVLATIENRDSLSPGGHYVAVMATIGGGKDENQDFSGVGLEQSIASLVFVKKIGGEIYFLDLKKISLPNIAFSLPEKINLEFENSGNVHVVPRGIIEILGPFGRVLGKGVINRSSAIILPGMVRAGNHTLDRRSALFFPGHYTVRVNYRYDGQDGFMTKETDFFSWGSIWADLIALLTILSLSAIVTRSVVKKRNKKALDKQKNAKEKQN